MTSSTAVAPLDAALFYAGLGWRVVPIKPGTKRPGLEAWQEHATTDPGLIAEWWGRWPDHGVGIATGERSGVFVLDVDSAEGKVGDESLAELEAQHGPLPATVEAITGSGGRHLFYRHPPGLELNNSAGRLGPDLDIRANGGQVVAWPTFHPDTGARYEWNVEAHPAEVAVAEAPAWLLELLEPPPAIEVGPRGSFEAATLAWDRYNRAPGAADEAARLLIAAGWQEGRPDRTGARYFTRPGKRHGIGATLGRVAPGVVYCFTSSAPPLEGERAYDPADLFALLVHDGDRAAADRALVEAGWGIPSYSITADDLADYIAGAGAPIAPGSSADLWLPDELWTARPLLAQIRQAARSRLVAPDAVLGALLARVAALAGHTVELPPIVGGAVGLTFYSLIIGPPSAGKSAAVALAARLLPAPSSVPDRLPIGSGEGFVDVLFEMVSEEGDDGKRRTVKQQTKHAAIFHVDEGEVLGDLGQRSGSTILPTLRSAFTHSTLGQANASIERRRILDGRTYVYGVTMALQPSKAAGLLADTAGGTPQRFVWTMATDPHASRPLPPWPGPLEWEAPRAALEAQARAAGEHYGRLPLHVPAEVVDEVLEHRLGALTGSAPVDEAEAHAVLVRLKVAGLLCLLDGRASIVADDWRLAGIIVDTSRRVRGHVEQILAHEAKQLERVAIGRRVNAELAVADAGEARALARAAKAVGRACHRHAADEVHDGRGCSRKCWLQATRHRPIEEAIDEAGRLDWIRPEGERWQPGPSRPV